MNRAASAYMRSEGALPCRPNAQIATLAAYRQRLVPFLRQKQIAASTFVPRTRIGIGFRRWVVRLMGIRGLAGYFIGRQLRDDFPGPR
ncbi:MAG: hypothetical protein KDH88_20435 [Chromatiales bacterium]|nr:hypothetical protein [Chromatiales bacterium]